ncbi:MAG: CDP-alcohol phosphatidyltransferase family protein [Candidatus Eiseniibacteriota bacterium]
MDRTPVPSVATLRQRVHSGKLSRDRRAWYAWSRGLSIYVTWVLLHFPVQANQVTVVSVALAFTGACLLASTHPWIAVAGAAALLLHHFLDKVDGDIARFRSSYSLRGVYLDDVGHAIAGGGIFVGLGLHLARSAGERAAIPLLAAGAIGALAMVIGNQSKNAGFLMFARGVLSQPELLPARRASSALEVLSRQATHQNRGADMHSPTQRGSGLTWLRDAVLIASDYTLMLPLVAAGLIAEALWGARAFLEWLLAAECALQLAVLAALIYINYQFNVENECLRLDALARSRSDERTQ